MAALRFHLPMPSLPTEVILQIFASESLTSEDFLPLLAASLRFRALAIHAIGRRFASPSHPCPTVCPPLFAVVPSSPPSGSKRFTVARIGKEIGPEWVPEKRMWRMGAVAVQKGNNRFLDVAANETSQAMISFVHVPSHSAATFAFLSPGSGGHVMHTLTLPFVSVGRHRLRVADGTGEVVLRIRPMTTHETRRRDEYDLVVGVEDVYVTSGRLLAKTCTPVAGGDRTREDDAVTSVRNKRRNSSQDMLPAKQWAPECLEQAAWWCQ